MENERNIKKIIFEHINESNLFNRPIVDFILYDDTNLPGKTIIGLHEEDNENSSIIYDLQTEESIILNEMIFNTKDQIMTDLYKGTPESYLIVQLENDQVDINYVSLQFHIKLWKYISSLEEQIRWNYFSIKYYLKYCERTGINFTILKTYSDDKFEDLIANFKFIGGEDLFFHMFETFNWKICDMIIENNKILLKELLKLYMPYDGDKNEK